MANTEYPMMFENGVVIGDHLWFTEYRYSELYKYSFSTNKVEYIGKIGREEGERLFGEIIAYGDELYFIPMAAKDAYCFNTKSLSCERIEIREVNQSRYKGYNDKAKFLSAHFFENSIYMMGATYPEIVEYDCIKKEVKYHGGWYEEIKQYFKTDSETAIFRKTKLYDGKIYAPLCAGNAVFIFDIALKKYEIYIVGREDCRYSSICKVGDTLWLAPRGNSCIVEWNIKTNLQKHHAISIDKYNVQKQSCADVVAIKENIYILPWNWNPIVVLNTVTKELKILEGVGEHKHASCIVNENDTYIYSSQGILYRVQKTGSLEEIGKIIVPQEQFRKYRQRDIATSNNITYEITDYDLEILLDKVLKYDLETKDKLGNSNVSGKIYGYL